MEGTVSRLYMCKSVGTTMLIVKIRMMMVTTVIPLIIIIINMMMMMMTMTISINQLHKKFRGHFATPLEYVI